MSSPADNQGEIDGRPVTWFYQRAENDQEGRLSWAEGRVTCKYCLWLWSFSRERESHFLAVIAVEMF